MTDPAPATPPTNPIAEVLRNPAARTYLLVSAAGLLVTAAGVYLLYASLFGALVVLVFGAGGLALKWAAGPPVVVVGLSYSLFFPFGLPVNVPMVSQIPGSHFAFEDLLLVAAAAVHLIAAYRYHSVVRAGMPFEAKAEFIKPGAKPTVRPAEPVRDPELWFLFARVGVFVLGGQLLWLLITKLRVDFREDFPLRRVAGFKEEAGFNDDGGALPNSLSRFLLAATAILSLAFAVWLAFWYWRLSVMNRDEARAACLDAEWATARRDLDRTEKWRGRMRQKLAGTLPRKGCGAWFLVAGLPVIMVCLFLLALSCMGAFR